MKPLTRHIVLLLSAYFLLFSLLPQDYSFIEKIASSIDKMTADVSDLESSDTNEADEEDDENTPPTLVEEEDSYLAEHPASALRLRELSARYYLTNENCKGISPSILLPPPDLLSV